MGITVNVVSVPGDWELLYIDDALVAEGHSIDASDILRHVEGETVEAWSTEWRDINANRVDTGHYSELPEGD